jgi:hypothetical protein
LHRRRFGLGFELPAQDQLQPLVERLHLGPLPLFGSRSPTAAISFSRPMNVVNWMGRLAAGI